MENKEINWEEVDKESAEHLKKCMLVDKQIRKSRAQKKTIEQTAKEVEDVNQFLEEQNIPSITLELPTEEKKS